MEFGKKKFPEIDLFDFMSFFGLDFFFNFLTYCALIRTTLPGRYNLLRIMLSNMPPVLPIRKHPGFIPPTVAGPMT